MPSITRATIDSPFWHCRLVCSLTIGGLLCFVAGCGSKPAGGKTNGSDKPLVQTDDAELGAKITAFCGGCHVMPQAESFPKAAWHEEVERGFGFFFQSNRTDLEPPDMSKVVDYFRSRAPDQLLPPVVENSTDPPPVTFSKEKVTTRIAGEPAAIAHVNSIANVPGLGAGLLSCDMRNGNILFIDPMNVTGGGQSVFATKNPAHIEPTDLDGNGEPDFVVADLGSFLPEDHDQGKVFWFRSVDGGWRQEVLMERVGRVAAVEPGDFTGDGLVDLIVAEFGWHKTGGIWLLKNMGGDSAAPLFEQSEIDARPGTIHVPQCDLNGDGKLDFVALISQEFELVIAYLNTGDGKFKAETIWEAPDPSYGSSGIELVDMDGDGDLDVLYTNGDTFDSFYIKPFHSIQWLENRGVYPFEHHHLTKMPGVHRALAGDLDGDGDLDIVAAALLPARTVNESPDANFDSIICLEQVAPNKFVRHSLEQNLPRHATLELADFDGDQDLDFAVGGFLDVDQADQPWITIWSNEGK